MKKKRLKKTFAAVLTAALVLPTIGTSAFATESTAKVVTSYNFIDELDALTYMSDTGMYEMSVPTVSEENPLPRDVLASFLPASITAEIEFAEDLDADEQPAEEEKNTLTDNEEEPTVPDEENTPDVPDTSENDVPATEETPAPESTPADGEDTEDIPPVPEEEPVIPDEPETDMQPENVPDGLTEEEPADVPDEPTEEEPADVPDEESEPEITDPATEKVTPAGAHVLDITWDLSNYPESAWEGQYIITANLPDGYVLADDAIPMAVKVVLSDIVATLEEPVDNSTEEAPDIDTVESVPVEGVTVKVFNYGKSVNSGYDLADAGYNFFDGGEYSGEDDTTGRTVDGPGPNLSAVEEKTGVYKGVNGEYNQPVMTGSLDQNKYPMTTEGTTAYLFDGSDGRLKGTMENGGGLFLQDAAGYYYYNSSENAAYFNGTEFELYNCTVVPAYSDYAGTHDGNFLPFNPVQGINSETGKPYIKKYVKEGEATETDDKYILNDEDRTNITDNWFGMTMEFNFMMPKDGKIENKQTGVLEDMVFNFSGDDDVWVYIDGVLVMDIGGTHGATRGSINFGTGEVTDKVNQSNRTLNSIFDLGEGVNTFGDYTNHTFKFFYMERGGNISNCSLSFNMPILPQKSLSVTKEITSENLNVGNEDYMFRIMDAETDAAIAKNQRFAIWKDGKDTGETDTTDGNGIFTLNIGQTAVFENMSQYTEDKYYVEELIAVEDITQYSGVKTNIDGTESTLTAEQITGVLLLNDKAYKIVGTSDMTFDEAHSVTYTNVFDDDKLCNLTIVKEIDPDSEIPADETFDIEVKFNDEPAEGVKYVIVDENGTPGEAKTFSKDGIVTLKAKESILIEGIPSGTDYEITEQENDYITSYRGTVETVDGTEPIDLGETPTNAEGTFPPASSVTIYIRSEIEPPTPPAASTGGGSSKDKIRVTVEKEWKVPNDVEHPDGVKVRLYVDGAAHGKLITLDEDNDWTYTWSGIDEDADWEVKEVSVPEGYEVSYKTKGNKVTITNKYEKPDTPSEPTTPADPTTSVVPVKPADPVTPETPVVPVDPAVPETPASPNTPNAPEVELDDKTPSDKDHSTSERDSNDLPTLLGDTDTVIPSVPQTGDNNHIVLFGTLGILALAGIVVLKKTKSTK